MVVLRFEASKDLFLFLRQGNLIEMFFFGEAVQITKSEDFGVAPGIDSVPLSVPPTKAVATIYHQDDKSIQERGTGYKGRSKSGGIR